MIEVGQVLWMKLQFNKTGDIASVEHPVLILNINVSKKVIEVGHLDHLDEVNYYKALLPYNHLIEKSNPEESVILADSYLQMNNLFTLEYFKGLEKLRRTSNKLSTMKLKYALKEYNLYHKNNKLDDNRIVFMNKNMIMQLNPRVSNELIQEVMN
jgi:hypothetical protein